MTVPSPECQKVLTALRPDLLPWLESLTRENLPEHPLRLKLNLSQLPILAAYLSPNSTLALILSDPLSKIHTAFSSFQSWQELIAPGNNWHILTAPLTRQELNGDVLTKFSQSAHFFLSRQAGHHFLVPESALSVPFPASKLYRASALRLDTGQKTSLSDLTKKLARLGYYRHSQSLGPGSFTVNGENILIWPTASPHAYSLTWYRSTLEMINSVHRGQKKPLSHISIPPVRFPESHSAIAQQLTGLTVLGPGHLCKPRPPDIIFDSLTPQLDFPLQPSRDNSLSPHKSMVVFYQNYDRVAQKISRPNQPPPLLCSSPLATASLNLQSSRLQLVSELSLLGKTTALHPLSYEAGLKQIAQLKPDHPAVHSDHGIGIFEGLKSRTISGETRDYLVLRYAEGASVSVPVEYAHKVTAYLGESHPPIQKLGGLAWKKTKAKAIRDAAAFAAELLRLAGKREQSTNHAYRLDAQLENLLGSSFPYDLTPGQKQAWQEIKEDLSRPQAMDRLVVGDVGFGKTELAFRAALHVAANGYQVALLAPTTLLAQQHTDTFLTRLQFNSNRHCEPRPFMGGRSNPQPIRTGFEQTAIGTLSRFQTVREQKKTREKIADGSLKIVVGTHALLAPSVRWKNLGLLIIDEEQRFGVRQKERLKKIRANVDILSLSATPIPRTLSMALTGLKQLSLISSPPQGRKDVATKVMPDHDAVYQKALAAEKARGGQSYVVTPRISQIPSLLHRLPLLLPGLKFAAVHGRLPAKDISSVIHQFDAGQTDVLISSSIIESGLDHPRANTIIVAKSTFFGLSDLYQLRGRIGRRSVQGRAYFLYSQSELTTIQRQRLTALTESARLGSGWSLAQRDLEIRGAGNLLGADQSGTINEIGVQLYLDLVREAADKSPASSRRDVEISLPLTSFLPSHYIASDVLRTEYYQQLSRASAPVQLDRLYEEIQEKFGPLPPEARSHRLLLQLQLAAAAQGITSLTYQTVTPASDEKYYRLKITADKLPPILAKVSPLGDWKITADQIYLAVWELDQKLIQQLLKLLQ